MRKVLSIAILSLFVALCYAQEVPKPEFVNTPYFWDEESTTKINVPKVSLVIDSNEPVLFTFFMEN